MNTQAPTAPAAHALALSREAQDLLFHNARTANTFTDAPVTDEHIQAIYDLVKWAPTSMNLQSLRIVLVRSADARAKLVGHLMEGNQAKTAAAPLVAILAADINFHEELPRMFPHYPGAKDMFGDDGMRENVARFNASLQVGYFILGVRAAGLAAGPMTGFNADGINQDFFADGQHKVLAVVNIGEPGEGAWFDRLPRLEYDEVVSTI